MFKEMTTKKKIIIVVIVVVVLVTIFLVIRYKRKKKKERESAYQAPSAQQTAPQKPKMQIVPEEDKPRETKTPEPAMSVEQVVPEKQTPVAAKGAPGTLGVPGNGTANAGNKPQAASSLPPEFLTNTN